MPVSGPREWTQSDGQRSPPVAEPYRTAKHAIDDGAERASETWPFTSIRRGADADFASRSAFGRIFYAGEMKIVCGDWRANVGRNTMAWIPAAQPCEFHGADIHCLSLRESASGALPRSPTRFVPSRILRELLHHLEDTSGAKWSAERQQHFSQILLEELREAIASPRLRMPEDRRLLKIAETLLRDPSDTRRLDDWAAQVGASARQLARKFIQETGLNYAKWRMHARIAAADALLDSQVPLDSVVRRVGYGSRAAFVRMLKRSGGLTSSGCTRAIVKRKKHT